MVNVASSFPISLKGERKRFLFLYPVLFCNQSHKIHSISQVFTESFAVDFRDRLRSILGIICGTVQYNCGFRHNICNIYIIVNVCEHNITDIIVDMVISLSYNPLIIGICLAIENVNLRKLFNEMASLASMKCSKIVLYTE